MTIFGQYGALFDSYETLTLHILQTQSQGPNGLSLEKLGIPDSQDGHTVKFIGWHKGFARYAEVSRSERAGKRKVWAYLRRDRYERAVEVGFFGGYDTTTGLASRTELELRGEFAPIVRIFDHKEIEFRKFLTLGDDGPIDWATLHYRIVYCLTKEDARPDGGDVEIAGKMRERFASDILESPHHERTFKKED